MPPVPERFQVSRRTLRFDRFMTRLVAFGGISIITAVFGIFAFIAFVAWPLFRGPKLTPETTFTLPAQPGAVFGLNDRATAAFTYHGGPDLAFITHHSSLITQNLPLNLPPGATPTAWKLNTRGDLLLIGTADGQILQLHLIPPADKNSPPVALTAPAATPLLPGLPILALDQTETGSRRLHAALQRREDGATLITIADTRLKRDLLGGIQTEPLPVATLDHLLPGFTPVQILTPGSADSLLLRSAEGEVAYLFRADTGWELRQRFRPFDSPGSNLTAMCLLLGDVTAIFTDDTGRLRLFQLHIPTGAPHRVFALTREMQPLSSGGDAITWIAPSPRNKTFLAGSDTQLALIHSTTGAVRHRMTLPAPIVQATFAPRAGHIALLDRAGSLQLHRLDDPHPEAGWRAFFGKVWYEGHTEPKWMWQSTGGTSDYEPKLSLVPLVIGSLKGTLYAMLFSIPIALLAAIYTSHFLGQKARHYVKPVMEIMASLPSVVLGFLAALWLAPLIEDRVPSLLLMIAVIPVTALLAGTLWKRLPVRLRNRVPPGFEFWLLIPLLLAGLVTAWHLGPVLEKNVFIATLGDGTRIADFRLWWPEFTGLPFDQRNSLVVGFMMGFAVIPVIFTIAEDALSNVPPALTSAAEALGASRWQVVRTVVLPVASAGIFSALIIGLGRAVGETMIVVMATGNTPIMDESGRLLIGSHWNLFDGMRTLAANIAVELPEAAQNSTHYRTLFLGALLLFLMTFLLNTVAELLRHHLRNKFRIV